METVTRENWTDARLGERFDHVEERFNRVETGIRDLRGDMDRGFAQSTPMRATFALK